MKIGTLLVSVAMATTGLLVPAPASAGEGCENLTIAYCSENWSENYTSFEACMEREMIIRCRVRPAPYPPPYTRP